MKKPDVYLVDHDFFGNKIEGKKYTIILSYFLIIFLIVAISWIVNLIVTEAFQEATDNAIQQIVTRYELVF